MTAWHGHDLPGLLANRPVFDADPGYALLWAGIDPRYVRQLLEMRSWFLQRRGAA